MPGPVDADDAEAVLVGVPPGLERDLAAGPGGAVHPDDRGAAGRAELGEAEPAAVADGDGALEGGALMLVTAEVFQVRRPALGQDSAGDRGGVDDVPRVAPGRRAPCRRRPPAARRRGRGRRTVMLSRPPASRASWVSSAAASSSSSAAQHLGDPVVVDQVGQPVAAQQQPVARPRRRGGRRRGRRPRGRRRPSGARRCARGGWPGRRGSSCRSR